MEQLRDGGLSDSAGAVEVAGPAISAAHLYALPDSPTEDFLDSLVAGLARLMLLEPRLKADEQRVKVDTVVWADMLFVERMVHDGSPQFFISACRRGVWKHRRALNGSTG